MILSPSETDGAEPERCILVCRPMVALAMQESHRTWPAHLLTQSVEARSDGAGQAVAISRDAFGYVADVAGVGSFHIGRGGTLIRSLGGAADPTDPAFAEAVLGPCLVFALALQSVWCFHASAVHLGGHGGVAAFAGESGCGKSTLAAFLHADPATGWRRASDDILMVAHVATHAVARPAFPQLKLSAEDQPSHHLPEELPLRCFYVLVDQAGATDVAIGSVGPVDAMRALIRHTVASRIFDDGLTRAHLAFCARLAETLPVRSLTYPRDRRLLPAVRDALRADLST